MIFFDADHLSTARHDDPMGADRGPESRIFFFIFWVLKIEESRLSLPRGETPENVGFSLAVRFRGYVFFWQVVVEAKGAKSCAFSTFVVHDSTFPVARCTIAFCSVVFKRSLC